MNLKISFSLKTASEISISRRHKIRVKNRHDFSFRKCLNQTPKMEQSVTLGRFSPKTTMPCRSPSRYSTSKSSSPTPGAEEVEETHLAGAAARRSPREEEGGAVPPALCSRDRPNRQTTDIFAETEKNKDVAPFVLIVHLSPAVRLIHASFERTLAQQIKSQRSCQ